MGFAVFRIKVARLLQQSHSLVRLSLHVENVPSYGESCRIIAVLVHRDDRHGVGALVLPLSDQECCIVGISAGIVRLKFGVADEQFVGLGCLSFGGLNAGASEQ